MPHHHDEVEASFDYSSIHGVEDCKLDWFTFLINQEPGENHLEHILPGVIPPFEVNYASGIDQNQFVAYNLSLNSFVILQGHRLFPPTGKEIMWPRDNHGCESWRGPPVNS